MNCEPEKYTSNLKIIRLERGLTIEELAKGTGVAERTIKSLESENGSNPQLATIKRLKHINNALKEEIDNSTVAKFATVQNEGGRGIWRI